MKKVAALPGFEPMSKAFIDSIPGHQRRHRRLPRHQVVDVPLPHRGVGYRLLHCHEGNPGEAEVGLVMTTPSPLPSQELHRQYRTKGVRHHEIIRWL